MLAPNARIAVIAPAGAPDPADLDSGATLLRAWGFRVIEGAHLRGRHRYNAGTVAERSADLAWALEDPDIDAVWLARGGYGCIQCLPKLPPDLPAGRVVIGCSDATALLVALAARGFAHLIHGPMVEGLVARADATSRSWIRAMLTGGAARSIAARRVCGPVAEVTGRLVGGNLTVLASLAGTAYALASAPEHVVVLEDVGETPYRLDRAVMQLRLSGALRNARAIVLGQFIRCLPPQGANFTLEEVLPDLFEPLGVPVFATDEIGHGARNLGWRYGGAVTLRDGTLHFET